MSQDAAPKEAAGEDAARWRFGEVLLDERIMELSVGGQKVELARKPLELLMYFVRNPGEVVTKDELFEAVWPGRIVSETSLTNAIGRLRGALGDEEAQALIKSVYGYGYRFMGEVVREDARIASLPAPQPELDFKDGDPVPFRAGWVLRKRLGAGGGGDVWLGAETATHDARVFKFARDRLALTALKREITLSRLMRESLGERPDFVRVLDWSLDEPPYFIAIDWCNEGSLADWAEAAGGIKAMPLPQRLELLAQAAEALAAAHSVGVLHKDLKPSNLLLQKSAKGDGALQVRLSDFGSARLLDRDRLNSLNIAQLGFTQTIADTTTGTPLYLAPELLDGSPPTIRSDVYALGVILYQLAVGDLRRSLAPGWELKVEDPLLIEDIGAAAAGDPQSRMVDAAELAARLRSLPQRREAREREQAAAREAAATRTALERAQARRGVLQALAATLLIGIIATGALYWRAARARNEARASAALAQQEAARAGAVTSFLTRDLLGAANPVIAGRRDVRVREILDDAQKRLDDSFGDQPAVRATLERVIGSAYAAMGETEPALRLLSAAEKDLSAQQGEAADETEEARVALRDMYINQLDFPNTFRWSARIATVEQAAGRPHAELAADAESLVQSVQCIGQYRSPKLARCAGPIDALYRAALARFGPDSFVTQRAMLYQGVIRIYNDRYADALPLLRTTREKMRHQHGVDDIWLSQSEDLFLNALVGAGQAAEALPLLEARVASDTRIYGPDYRTTLIARRLRARAWLDLGRAGEALAEEKELLSALQQKGAGAIDYGPVAVNLALTLQRLNRPADAERVIREALDYVAPQEKPSGFWTLSLRELLADGRLQLKDAAGAEALLRQNLEQAGAILIKGEWLLGWEQYRLGEFLCGHGRCAEGLPLLTAAPPILGAALSADDPRTLRAQAALDQARKS